MLEDQIASLTLAINNLAAAFASGRSAAAPTDSPAPETPAKTKKEKAAVAASTVVEPEVTEDMIMEAGQRILTAGKKPKIAELNKKFGVERGRELLKGDDKAKLFAYFTELKAIADAA